MTRPEATPSGPWQRHLVTALDSARRAGKELRAQFGASVVSRYKGRHDIQLTADLKAQQVIVSSLSAIFPKAGMVAEEKMPESWPEEDLIWVIDPLDGTNNYGFGIAHCAISISLFSFDRVVLSVVVDPLLNREFYAAENQPGPALAADHVPLRRATISLVTNYSDEGRIWGVRASDLLGSRCKRIVSLWAPSLDLALISEGALDGMVCHRGYMLDVCGGVFLVAAAGGSVLDLAGRPFSVRGSMYASPVSFVAARTPELADELLDQVRAMGM